MVEYLGHIIIEEDVTGDQSKIKAMVEWPRPANVKALRGFLGFTGYYRWFVRDYGVVSKSLTQLLKKNAFDWKDKAGLAFE